MKFLVSLAALAAVVFLSGCAVLNPRPLTVPVNDPTAAFDYTLGAQLTDAEGNQTIAPADTIKVDQNSLKDNWSINMVRTYQDSYKPEAIEILAATLDNDDLTSAGLLTVASMTAMIVNANDPVLLSTESVDVSRANDPDAWRDARIAQFEASRAYGTDQLDRSLSALETAVRYSTPAGAIGAEVGSLAEALKGAE